MYAFLSGNFEAVKLLTEYGIDINSTNEKLCPLSLSVKIKNKQIFDFLLSKTTILLNFKEWYNPVLVRIFELSEKGDYPDY